jgi:hypothetical protein
MFAGTTAYHKSLLIHNIFFIKAYLIALKEYLKKNFKTLVFKIITKIKYIVKKLYFWKKVF